MSRRCLNCNYEREPTDIAPVWQCPACEKAYNKGAGAAVPENYGRTAAPAVIRPASSTGFAKWLLILTVLSVVVWIGKTVWQPKAGLSAQNVAWNAEQPEVILYATDWCGYCAATRRLFAANGIRYTELDIEKNRDAQEGHRRLGGKGVPLIVVGQEVFHGYNEAGLKAALQPWLKGS